MSDRAREDATEVGHEQSRSNRRGWAGSRRPGMKGPSGCGRRAVVFEWVRLDQRRAIGPEKTWWRVEDERSGPKGHGWVGDGRSGSREYGGGGRRAVGLERTWLECEASDWA